jgi:ribosomal protein S18 acetylase RimI-like enzyme
MNEKNLAVNQITAGNLTDIKEIYEDFIGKAVSQYGYDYEPLEFIRFLHNIKNSLLGGFVLLDEGKPVGLMIFAPENHQAVEINVIHIASGEDINKKRILLIQALLKYLDNRSDWKAVSYPLLGVQESFVREITHSGFKLVGQSVVKFLFQDSASYQVLKKAEVSNLPEGYRIIFWDDKYKEQVIELTNLGFMKNRNQGFDPRYLTLEGCKDIVDNITANSYGIFLPFQSRLIVNGDRLEAFCLASMVDEERINIPLITVRKDNRNKGLGKYVLKNLLTGFLNLITNKGFKFKEINATVETDNSPAVKMYRRLGFREDYFYAHAFITKI